jgi:L-alanine-DL-glutamate epimerase-like enolase superfamily enzyme
MRIIEIHIYQKDLLLVQPYTMAGTVLQALDSTIVKLVCDNGLIGWGETCPVGPTYQPEHTAGGSHTCAVTDPSGQLYFLFSLMY